MNVNLPGLNTMTRVALFALCVGLSSSCAKEAKRPAAESLSATKARPAATRTAPMVHGDPAASAKRPGAANRAAGREAGAAAMTGEVLETLAAPPYIYVRLKTDQGETWIAAPQTEVAVGEMLQVSEAMEMKSFKSKTLGREFKSVYFASSVAKLGSGQKPAGHAGMAKPAGHPGGARPKAAPGVVPKAVAKAGGEAGRTVAEVHSQRAALKGKQVVVRGTVLKFNGGIMGRNWLHVQDTTGDAAAGTNDLTVTTADSARPGDVVTVTGTVATDKDFGAGYAYAVLIEQAKVAVEPQ